MALGPISLEIEVQVIDYEQNFYKWFNGYAGRRSNIAHTLFSFGVILDQLGSES